MKIVQILCATALIFNGCSGSKEGVRKTLRVALSEEPTTIDRRSSGDTISSAMHFLLNCGLTRITKNNEVANDLEESITISAFQINLKEALNNISQTYCLLDCINDGDLKSFIQSELDKTCLVLENIGQLWARSETIPNSWFKKKITDCSKGFPTSLPDEKGFCDESDAIKFRDIVLRVKSALDGLPIHLVNCVQEQFNENNRRKRVSLEKTLFAEQKALDENHIFYDQLSSFGDFLKSRRSSPQVYIVYAWPLDDSRTQDREGEVQAFLRILESHLLKLGIKAKLDVKHCHKGSDIHRYIRKGIDNADTVLIVGTHSLQKKFENYGGVPLVCSEINLAMQKIKKSLERNEFTIKPVVLPILLIGSIEDSFPANFQAHLNTILLPEIGYLNGLKQLVYNLYGFPNLNTTRRSFEMVWDEYFSKSEIIDINQSFLQNRREILREYGNSIISS